MTRELEGFGFKVDIYYDDAVTVDLFRHLPDHGYKLIIFRVHSGLLGVDPKVTNRTWLFTNEIYSKTKYLNEQLTDQITYARTDEGSPWCFAISAKFITESLKKNFNNTAIVMMGCDCLHFTDMAQAFVDKGAAIYLAWDVSVMLGYVDDTTTSLVEKLCSDELTIEEAVYDTMREKGPDPNLGAVLKFYPPQAAEKTLRQLIG
jgi:hypothetical protein